VRRCRSPHRRFAIVDANSATFGPRMTISGVTRCIPSLYSQMSTNTQTLCPSEPVSSGKTKRESFASDSELRSPLGCSSTIRHTGAGAGPNSSPLRRILTSPAPSLSGRQYLSRALGRRHANPRSTFLRSSALPRHAVALHITRAEFPSPLRTLFDPFITVFSP
jgi:hypothetical protein